jgi:RNA 3'-terminal phosphate cyclase (ATP)
MIEIAGDTGEGGGQIARMAVALAAVTGRPLRLTRIRARRAKPGLAPQHLTALRAVAHLAGGDIEGLALGATEVVFHPGALRGGHFEFDVGTAGSITLLVQALLPVMTAAHAPVTVRLIGGTDVRMAPPLDYLRHVLLPLLARFGVVATLDLERRGYYPRGGGAVRLSVSPCVLRPAGQIVAGELRSVRAYVHTAGLPAHVAQRMLASATHSLGPRAPAVDAVMDDAAVAFGAGGAIVLVSDRGSSVLGAGRVAERGVRAETVGEAVGAELKRDLELGVALDHHAADQLIVWLALAGGESSFTTAEATTHATTAMWLAEQFLPVRFEADAPAMGGVTTIRCRPAGPR